MALITARLWMGAGLLALLASTTSADEVFLSPENVVADKDGKPLYVTDYTAKAVATFDVAGANVTRTTARPDRPGGIALAPDGACLYVTGAEPAGRVHIVNAADGRIVGEILAVGHTPTAPVVSPDGKTLYVCNRFNNNVAAIDLAAKKVVATISVVREPVAAAITPDGKQLFVANLLPLGPGDADVVAAAVSVVDIASKTATTIALPNGSSGVRGICVAPDGKHAYATHLLSRYQLPTTQLERGWMNTNAMSIIDVAGKTLVNTVLLDDVDHGGANPWGITCTADGKTICVTHAGTHEISIVDRAAMHDKLARLAKGEEVPGASRTSADVPNDLAFLVDIRRRLKLAGNGPRGLVVLGTKAYAAEYFTDTLGVVDINPAVRPNAQSLALGPRKPLTVVRKGEMFFNDAALCFQHWQSCASCHPDARVDGFNWDLLNDGIGNPKNTKSMLLSHKTPPVMMTGIRDTAEVAVRSGIKNIQFAVRPEEDAVAIDEFLKQLEPVPSPYLVNGQLRPAAKRGEELFKTAGCINCHPGPLYTDMKPYDVGTGKDMEKGRKFDNPTLVEVWRTGPYLYDGRAVTIADVLTKFNAGDRHGKTSNLTPEQINDLAEYVLSR